MPGMIRRSASFMFYLLLVVALAGCTRARSPLERHRADLYPIPADAEKIDVLQGKFGGRLVYPLLRPPRTFNPLAASDEDTVTVTSLIHATLLEIDRSSMQIMPGLAKSWQPENGGRDVRLQLRRDVRFSDGQRFNADDVIFTFDVIYAENSHNVRKDDLTLRDDKIKYTRVGDYEILLEFSFVYAPALYLLTTIPILSRHLLQPLLSGRPVEALMGLETAPDKCVGLGPFRLKQINANERIVLEANPHYWKTDSSGRRLPYLNELILPVVNSRDSAFLQFRSGIVDLIDRLRVEDYLALANKKLEGIQVQNAGASTKLDLLWVNQNSGFTSSKRAYFGNPIFRRALARAIDRRALVENVYHGQAEILSELWPPSLRQWYTHLPSYSYNPDEAVTFFLRAGLKLIEQNGRKQLLDAAGKPLTLMLLINTNPIKEAIATMLQEDFLRVGIQLQISQSDQRALINRFLNKRDYEMVLFTIAVPPEPADLQSVLKSRGEQHMWNPAQKTPATLWEAEIDRLVDDIVTIPGVERRRQLFARIQEIIVEQMPVIPLVSENVLIGLRNNVKNVRPSVLVPHLLWNGWELYVD
ncbi:MAG: ABC transporter substrate-binding protein [Acidobacteria bacterium]|nr:ABC transporter substrate-binding protein [Acidobacteriota bacterium]